MNNKYSNGKIYKLYNINNNKIYIGSTCHSLAKRFYEHVNDTNRYFKGNFSYISSCEVFEKINNSENVRIELLDNVNCLNKNQLTRIERNYIENTDNCINKRIPSRESKEASLAYYYKNKEKILKKIHEKKTLCELCDVVIIGSNFSRHLRSKKHLKLCSNC